MTLRVLDPRQSAHGEALRMAPPLASLSGAVVGMIDIFVIWQLIVLSMGLAVLYRRRTQPVAVTLLAIYFTIAVIVAVVRRGAGA